MYAAVLLLICISNGNVDFDPRNVIAFGNLHEGIASRLPFRFSFRINRFKLVLD